MERTATSHIRQVGFTVYMMVEFQGTGKTTTCGKLAAYNRMERSRDAMHVTYRPAAIDQLRGSW